MHFSSLERQINAPTGLVYYEGEYHLFFLGANEKDGESMFWGHAVSSDLIRWKELPDVLSGDSLKAVGLGSIVVDSKNTSGFGTAENPSLIAFFTSCNYEIEREGGLDVYTQELAYSLDKGFTWTRYTQPIIPNPGIYDFRDPKVLWHEQTQQWVMTLAMEGRLGFYTSANLKEWTYVSGFGIGLDIETNMWEQPDLFEISFNNGNETKWVLIVNIVLGFSDNCFTGYFVGEFDGKSFSTTQTQPLWLDFGENIYNGITCKDLLNERQVWIGQMNDRAYTDVAFESFGGGSLSIPRELRLKKIADSYLLISSPIKEVEILYGKRKVIRDMSVVQDIHSSGILDITPQIPFSLLPLELNICFRTNAEGIMNFAERFGIIFKNGKGEYILAGYNAYHQLLYIDRKSLNMEGMTGIHSVSCGIGGSETFNMRIILDATSLELFTLDGEIAMTDAFYPSSNLNSLGIFAENGKVEIESVSITQLKLIW
ncbi:MAG: glycoside hydrolase family 32 protein [Tannerellaceae bacterium]|jgi:fructan beta-fructosidase|nr:glycoside hydrolase family 32 protein [Tannerellaceae bacterium]